MRWLATLMACYQLLLDFIKEMQDAIQIHRIKQSERMKK